jgi:cysteine desulfurase family protein (TIGR01976 family)
VSLDLAWIRSQFPALSQTINDRPAIFFDGPGGTQVPGRVIDGISDYLKTSNANEGGVFATSQRTEAIVWAAHEAMADFLGCDADEVAFGANMTTLTFAFSRSLGRELQAGDEIVITRLDHDANVAPWKALEERGVIVRFVDIHVEDCTLDMEDLEKQISDRTRLIAVGYASNAVGTVNDIEKVVKLARAVGALTFVDAVHYGPHGPIDVKKLDCDFLACSPYKFFGPHAGALYGKREHMNRLRPYKLRPSPDELPFRWETGTQNHEGLAGVIAAIDYIAEIGYRFAPGSSNRRAAIVSAMEVIRQYEKELSRVLIPGLLQIPGLKLYGISDSSRFDWRTPTVALRLAGYAPSEVTQQLSDRGIFAWHGNYYAINLTERLGVEASGGMVRMGLVHYNTVEEIQQMLAALNEIAQQRSQ